ncbi:hypothetical protein ACJX0J_028614, partial [Zea mays]
ILLSFFILFRLWSADRFEIEDNLLKITRLCCTNARTISPKALFTSHNTKYDETHYRAAALFFYTLMAQGSSVPLVERQIILNYFAWFTFPIIVKFSQHFN